jgi:aminobenzoyl-glutamate utilization protein B
MPNVVLAKAMHRNIAIVGPPRLTNSDKDFARQIEKNLGREPLMEPFDLTIKPPSGEMRVGAADDFTEFSWIAPTHRVYVTYNMVKPSPSWSTAAFASMNVGHQAVLTAAKLIACTLLDLFTNPSLLKEAQKEFIERTSENKWTSLIPQHQKPPIRPPLPESHYQALREACKNIPIKYIK